MRISEIAGLSVASGVGKHLEKMLLKPTKINFNSGHGTHQIRSDTFLSNLIAFRSEASEISIDDRNVHPVTFLGFCTTEEALSACLLYTSPSPRDQRGSRMPSSA